MPSLYRKWRSQSFDDLYGQEHVVQTLRNAVRGKRTAHAYLFTGPRGTGKTSTARILAKAVNCLDPQDGNPCNRCEACVAANDGRAIDVIEIDAASNTSVDNVRDLRDRVMYATGGGHFKIYIVDEVHRLSAAAFDAFLKTLEEPPPHVIFVFASTEPHKVPATIMSRCQRLDFRRIPAAVALERLRFVADAESLAVEESALRLIAQNGNGSLRDALGVLDQVSSYTQGRITEADVRATLGLGDPTLVARLTDSLVSGDLANGLKEAGGFVDAGGDPHQLTRQLTEYWRALLLRTSGAALGDLDVDPALEPHLARHAAAVDPSRAVSVLQSLSGREFSARYDVAPILSFEVAFVHASLALGARGAAPREAKGAIEQQDRASTPPAPTPSPPRGKAPEAPAIVAPTAPPLPSVTAAARSVDPPGDDLWQRIIAEMRAKSPSLQAVLRSGHMIRVQDGEVTIGFAYDFHRNQFSDVKKRKVLEEVIAGVLGATYRVTCVSLSKEEIDALKGAAGFEDDGFVEEANEQLRRFHARQLGNGTS